MRTDTPSSWAEYIAAGYQREVSINLLQNPNGPLRPGSYAYRMGHLQSGTLTKTLFDKPSIGNAACAVLKFKTVAPTIADKFDGDYTGYPAAFPFYPQTNVRPEILVRKSGSEFLKLQWNTFYTDERKVYARPEGPFGTIGGMEFVCYDRMIYAEEMYVDQLGTYPMPAADVVEFIAGELGISVDERSEIGNFLVDSPTNVYTMREVLRFIAAGSGGNFVINSMGKLQLIPFGSPAETEEQDCSELDYGVALAVTGVRLFPDSEKQYFSGTEDGFVVEGECAYATQELCDAVAAKLIGKVYRPFEAKEVRLDPAAELGDSIRLGGMDFTLASVSYSFGFAMAATVGAPWLEDVEHQIPYQSRDRQTRMTAQSFSEIRKSTQEIALEVQGKVDEGEVNNLIGVGLNGITLTAEEGENKCTITLTGKGLDAKQVVASFKKIIADEVSASNVTAGTMQADEINTDGSFCAGYTDRYGNFYPGGYMGYTPSTLDGSDGVHLTNESEDAEVRVTPNGAALECGWSSVVCTYDNLSLNAGTYASVEVDGWVYEFYGGDFYPAGTDQYLGTYSNPWEAVYAETGSILSSDERKKKDIVRDLSRYQEFFRKLIPACGKMVNGTSGRTHIYFVAQDVENAMGECGLTDLDFAGFVKSPVKDEGGNLIDYIYALRYEEFIPLIVDAVQQQETRLARIEQALNLQ